MTETSSTAVVESLTLFDGGEPRVVLADQGIYYAVCPNGATCPYPGRAARPATALAPRRVALELALRTFAETSADGATLPHLYAPFGLFPTGSGHDSLLASPLGLP